MYYTVMEKDGYGLVHRDLGLDIIVPNGGQRKIKVTYAKDGTPAYKVMDHSKPTASHGTLKGMFEAYVRENEPVDNKADEKIEDVLRYCDRVIRAASNYDGQYFDGKQYVAKGVKKILEDNEG